MRILCNVNPENPYLEIFPRLIVVDTNDRKFYRIGFEVYTETDEFKHPIIVKCIVYKLKRLIGNNIKRSNMSMVIMHHEMYQVFRPFLEFNGLHAYIDGIQIAITSHVDVGSILIMEKTEARTHEPQGFDY